MRFSSAIGLKSNSGSPVIVRLIVAQFSTPAEEDDFVADRRIGDTLVPPPSL